MFKFSSFMGAKRVKINSKFQLKKHSGKRRRHNDEEDRISQLPDDVLVYILSFLSSVKEAGRTSVLSSRWINLWKHFPCLNFDPDMVSYEIRNQLHYLVVRDKYVKSVDYILQSHKAPTVKELSIRFDLDESVEDSIDLWLEFAFSRRVERLELDLSYNVDAQHCYCFPYKLLTTPISSETVFDYFNSLKELSFKGVCVSRKAIDFVLLNCLILEKLVVDHSYEMSDHLQVCGSSLVLKHLEVVHCARLNSIEISAPNLISLKVSILDKLLLENTPMLVDVSVTIGGSDTTAYLERLLGSLSRCISQLEILNLVVMDDEAMESLCRFPELPKLKKLEIEYWGEGNQSFIGPTTLIRASPYLEEFHLRLALYVHGLNGDLQRGNNGEVVNARHEHLKVFKFCGYCGDTSDVELIKYILDNCVALENIIIDSFNVIREQRGLLRRARLRKSEKIARDHARQLLQPCETSQSLSGRGVARVSKSQPLQLHVPHHVELVIL